MAEFYQSYELIDEAAAHSRKLKSTAIVLLYGFFVVRHAKIKSLQGRILQDGNKTIRWDGF